MAGRRTAAVRVAVPSLLGAVALTGCSPAHPTPDAAVAPVPTAASSAPVETLSRATAGYGSGSAEAAVAALFFYTRVGDYPRVAQAYAPRVRRAVGADAIGAVYSLNRQVLSYRRPRIEPARRTAAGTRVAVEIARPQAGPLHSVYLLRRTPHGWRVAFDTFFARGIGNLAAMTKDGMLRKQPSPEALAASSRARSRFEQVFPAVG
jgi:hypothetical protein